MRIGIDLGGTKIEALAIGDDGAEMVRHRIDTPREYGLTVAALTALVKRIEDETGQRGTVGAGIPGTVSQKTGLVKNANSTWLNGMPLQVDLSAAMGREVRVANDANCLAVSEATDGAAAGARVVFGVILGTGSGGGVAIEGRIHNGANGVGGEWGHNPLPWPTPEELPGPECYCGLRGCTEKWVSGGGVAREFAEVTGRVMTTRAIAAAADAGDEQAEAAMLRWEERLGRALSVVVQILDPDVFVFGGGMSRLDRLYANLRGRMAPYVFGKEFDTPLVPAKYGDSSGVRGAAWLWPAKR